MLARNLTLTHDTTGFIDFFFEVCASKRKRFHLATISSAKALISHGPCGIQWQTTPRRPFLRKAQRFDVIKARGSTASSVCFYKVRPCTRICRLCETKKAAFEHVAS